MAIAENRETRNRSGGRSVEAGLVTAVLLLAVAAAGTTSAQPLRIGVIGDSMSAEYYGDYDPAGLLASVSETFGMGFLNSSTDCSGGNFGSEILAALLDGILPLVPMVTDLPARNWVQQLALHRSDDVSFGPLTNDPDLYGEPRLRGHEYNFARVSGTALSPGLGGHDMQQQLDAILPYIENDLLDVVFLMIGSNDFAARELKQQSFCDASWDDFEDEFVGAIFQGVDAMLAAGMNQIMIGVVPLGTAAGIAEGIVLQRINETNARIVAEANARGIPTLDPWRFNQDPTLMDPLTGDLFIGPHTVPAASFASIDDAVATPTSGTGILGACNTDGKCGTLATTLKFASTDGLHPGTVPQGYIANELIKAFNEHFGSNIALLSDQEILEAGGTFAPTPGLLSDIDQWVQIRQKGPNECLTIRDDDSNMTVESCSGGNSKQQWYVIAYDGAYMLRSAYTAPGHSEGTCIVDDDWRYKVANCSGAQTQRFDIYGGGADRNWFIEAESRDSCIYRYWLYEGGNTYGSLGNCGLTWGYDWMRWGFYSNGTGATELSGVVQATWLDSDGDGVEDGADAFPLHAGEWLDTDADGVGDNGDPFPNYGSATRVSFDDALADHAHGFEPETYYAGEYGLTISGLYFGVADGVDNGDTGGFGMNGTDGPAFLGSDSGLSSLPTFLFDARMDEVRLDVGLGLGASDDLTVQSFLGGSMVDTVVVQIADDLNGSGTWAGTVMAGPLDEVRVSSASGADFGIDSVEYVVPEPSSVLALLLGAGLLEFLARRRE